MPLGRIGSICIGLVLSAPVARAQDRGVGMTVMLAGRPDSVFAVSLAAARRERYSVVSMDSVGRWVTLRSPQGVQVRLLVEQRRDSSFLSIQSPSGTSDMQGLMASMQLMAAITGRDSTRAAAQRKPER